MGIICNTKKEKIMKKQQLAEEVLGRLSISELNKMAKRRVGKGAIFTKIITIIANKQKLQMA